METKLLHCLANVEVAYPGLQSTAKLILAAAATTRLKRSHPLCIILVGVPSSGKTSLLMPLTKAKKGSKVQAGVLRVDEFTPASLVSHASQKKAEELSKIDLLPKLKGKCVINKEMAPLFTGYEEEVMRRFSVLASVLDGEGYLSSSGNHGTRGYEDPIVFTLVGAVTPKVLSPKVMEAMSSVGPRLCFWSMPARTTGLGWEGPSNDRARHEAKAQSSMRDFLEYVFSQFESEEVPISDFILSAPIKCHLANIAVLMAKLRSGLHSVAGDVDDRPTQEISEEAPERAYSYLNQVLCGIALISGRRVIEMEDLVFAVKIALSSGKLDRAAMLRLLLNSTGSRTSQDFQGYLGITDDTARKRLALLVRLELVEQVGSDLIHEYDLKMELRNLRKALKDIGPL